MVRKLIPLKLWELYVFHDLILFGNTTNISTHTNIFFSFLFFFSISHIESESAKVQVLWCLQCISSCCWSHWMCLLFFTVSDRQKAWLRSGWWRTNCDWHFLRKSWWLVQMFRSEIVHKIFEQYQFWQTPFITKNTHHFWGQKQK